MKFASIFLIGNPMSASFLFFINSLLNEACTDHIFRCMTCLRWPNQNTGNPITIVQFLINWKNSDACSRKMNFHFWLFTKCFLFNKMLVVENKINMCACWVHPVTNQWRRFQDSKACMLSSFLRHFLILLSCSFNKCSISNQQRKKKVHYLEKQIGPLIFSEENWKKRSWFEN